MFDIYKDVVGSLPKSDRFVECFRLFLLFTYLSTAVPKPNSIDPNEKSVYYQTIAVIN